MPFLFSLLVGLISVLVLQTVALAAPNVTSENLLGFAINTLRVDLATQVEVFLTVIIFERRLVECRISYINFDGENTTIFVPSCINSNVTLAPEARNIFPFDLILDSVSASASFNGTDIATFNHQFTRPVVIPPTGTANSGNITNVFLTQGIQKSLAIVPFGVLDLFNSTIHVRFVAGILGLDMPLVVTGFHQASVPTT
ncbi:hypothetical protein B0H19DRAFT_951856 [Mycena capillaripes]|nr:hypothetical protein B0H19DRAFT_951856 [Mycena capillaripes]